MHRADSAILLYVRLMLLASAVALPGALSAQTGVSAAELRRCAEIARGAERLDCFDALTRELAQQSPAPSGVAETSAEPELASESAIDDFGAERIEDSDGDVPQEIQSRLIGEFTGWRRESVFRLENGQVWRQVGPGRLVHRADAPLITIRRGAFSSYRLGVEGVKTTVSVRRIQ